MLKHILVPVDLSDRHQHALEVAARLARESHGESRCCMSSKSLQALGAGARLHEADRRARPQPLDEFRSIP